MDLDDLLDPFDGDRKRRRRRTPPDGRAVDARDDEDDSEHGGRNLDPDDDHHHRGRSARDDDSEHGRHGHQAILERLRRNKPLLVAAVALGVILLVGAVILAVALARYIDQHGLKSVVDTVRGWFGGHWEGSDK
jgi:hypothetical protein